LQTIDLQTMSHNRSCPRDDCFTAAAPMSYWARSNKEPFSPGTSAGGVASGLEIGPPFRAQAVLGKKYGIRGYDHGEHIH
jgi:hypothetical protein